MIVFLNPLYRYLYYYSHGFSQHIPEMSYWKYWPRFFDGAFQLSVWAPGTPWSVEFEMVHIWFVTVLFLFFVLTAGVAAIMPELVAPRASCETGSSTVRSRILQLALATIVAWMGSVGLAACGLSVLGDSGSAA